MRTNHGNLDSIIKSSAGKSGFCIENLIFPLAYLTIAASVSYIGVSLYMYDPSKKQPSIQTYDVQGNKEPERFIDINGKRFYAEIDGAPVEKYAQKITPETNSQ